MPERAGQPACDTGQFPLAPSLRSETKIVLISERHANKPLIHLKTVAGPRVRFHRRRIYLRTLFFTEINGALPAILPEVFYDFMTL